MDEAETGRRTKMCSICKEFGQTFKYCHTRNEQHQGEVGSPNRASGTSSDRPLEASTMEINMANMEVAATGMIYLFEICCDECSVYYYCDLSNNYVTAYVLFSCVLQCNDVMLYVKLLCITYVLPLILLLITFCFCFLL